VKFRTSAHLLRLACLSSPRPRRHGMEVNRTADFIEIPTGDIDRLFAAVASAI
jgi:hypothetical protein